MSVASPLFDRYGKRGSENHPIGIRRCMHTDIWLAGQNELLLSPFRLQEETQSMDILLLKVEEKYI